MKRWLILALLCSPCFGAIARTGTPASHDCASATTCAVTYSPTAANGVIIFVQSNGTATISSVTDNGSGGSSTYTSLFNGACNTPGGGYNCGLFVTCNAKASVTTITANFSVADVGAIIASEYTGQATTSCADQASTAGSGTGTAFTAGTTGTTTQAAEAVFGAFLWDSLTFTLSATSGSYNHVLDQSCGGCGSSVGLMDRIVSSATTYTATATASSSITWVGFTVTIKAAASASGPCLGFKGKTGFTGKTGFKCT